MAGLVPGGFNSTPQSQSSLQSSLQSSMLGGPQPTQIAQNMVQPIDTPSNVLGATNYTPIYGSNQPGSIQGPQLAPSSGWIPGSIQPPTPSFGPQPQPPVASFGPQPPPTQQPPQSPWQPNQWQNQMSQQNSNNWMQQNMQQQNQGYYNQNQSQYAQNQGQVQPSNQMQPYRQDQQNQLATAASNPTGIS